MGIDRELSILAENYHLWDQDYTLEALDEVLKRADLTDSDRVALSAAVLSRHFDHRNE